MALYRQCKADVWYAASPVYDRDSDRPFAPTGHVDHYRKCVLAAGHKAPHTHVTTATNVADSIADVLYALQTLAGGAEALQDAALAAHPERGPFIGGQTGPSVDVWPDAFGGPRWPVE